MCVCVCVCVCVKCGSERLFTWHANGSSVLSSVRECGVRESVCVFVYGGTGRERVCVCVCSFMYVVGLVHVCVCVCVCVDRVAVNASSHGVPPAQMCERV